MGTASTPSNTSRMPTLFVAHGAPPLRDSPQWVGELREWARSFPKPRAILMISAHWESRPATLGATRPVPLVYDFYGFPERYYQQRYDAPGAPELAQRVRELLGKTNVADEPTRGLDHGTRVPLVAIYPDANVPVLRLSLPTLDARELLELGKALAPLRDDGVLIVGSGFLTHNLRLARWGGEPTGPAWAGDFDGSRRRSRARLPA